jgi:hypothetical protein
VPFFPALTPSRILSTTATPIKSVKNLAQTSSLKTDLRDYLSWLNANYGISRTTSVIPLMTKPSIADPYSKETPQKTNQRTHHFVSDRIHALLECTLSA